MLRKEINFFSFLFAEKAKRKITKRNAEFAFCNSCALLFWCDTVSDQGRNLYNFGTCVHIKRNMQNEINSVAMANRGKSLQSSLLNASLEIGKRKTKEINWRELQIAL